MSQILPALLQETTIKICVQSRSSVRCGILQMTRGCKPWLRSISGPLVPLHMSRLCAGVPFQMKFRQGDHPFVAAFDENQSNRAGGSQVPDCWNSWPYGRGCLLSNDIPTSHKHRLLYWPPSGSGTLLDQCISCNGPLAVNVMSTTLS
jgi:hypothetical protein